MFCLYPSIHYDSYRLAFLGSSGRSVTFTGYPI